MKKAISIIKPETMKDLEIIVSKIWDNFNQEVIDVCIIFIYLSFS